MWFEEKQHGCLLAGNRREIEKKPIRKLFRRLEAYHTFFEKTTLRIAGSIGVSYELLGA